MGGKSSSFDREKLSEEEKKIYDDAWKNFTTAIERAQDYQEQEAALETLGGNLSIYTHAGLTEAKGLEQAQDIIDKIGVAARAARQQQAEAAQQQAEGERIKSWQAQTQTQAQPTPAKGSTGGLPQDSLRF